MLTGKVISLHIAESSIHAAEAVIDRGLIEIHGAFTLNNVNRFFSRGRLINLGAMVETITMSMATNGFTAKRLIIAFDGAFTTTFSIDPVTSVEKKGPFPGRKKAKPEDETGLKDLGATVQHIHNWGQFLTQDEQGEAISVIQGERDMLTSMVAEFRSCGYRVISIEPPDTALIYLRNTIEFNYDSMNKIIVHADTEETGDLYVLTKDVPSTIKRIQFESLEGRDFRERIFNLCQSEVSRGQMRNPLVYLVGGAFTDMNTYTYIAEDLEFDGMQVMDLYGLAGDTVQIPEAVQIRFAAGSDLQSDGEFTCAYGLNVCLFLRCLEKKPENMAEGRFVSPFSAKKKLAFVQGFTVLAGLVLVLNVGLTATMGFEYFTINRVLKSETTLESTLKQAQGKRDAARKKIDALRTIDTRLEDVFQFIYENVDPTLNIASVDTVDMIPGAAGSQSMIGAQAGTGPTTDETGAAAPQESTGQGDAVPEKDPSSSSSATVAINQRPLVIRGYAMSSSGPIALYNALNTAGMGDVKLVGHQQMILPSGETIYAFEMKIGEEAGL